MVNHLKTLHSPHPLGNFTYAGLVHWLQGMHTIHPEHMFVASFSTESDSLEQWRAYCPNGGYAIGFPHATLKAMEPNTTYTLHQCVYDLDAQVQAIEEEMGHVNWYVLGAILSPPPGTAIEGDTNPRLPPSERSLAYKNLLYRVTKLCAILKHQSFKNESEWRLISAPGVPRDSSGRVEFRIDGNIIVPYVSVTLPGTDPWRDMRIMVGPTPHKDQAESAVRRLLRSKSDHCSNDQVSSSEIPYRYW